MRLAEQIENLQGSVESARGKPIVTVDTQQLASVLAAIDSLQEGPLVMSLENTRFRLSKLTGNPDLALADQVSTVESMMKARTEPESTHHHFHIPENHELDCVGSVVRIAPVDEAQKERRIKKLEQAITAWKTWCREGFDAGAIEPKAGIEIPWKADE